MKQIIQKLRKAFAVFFFDSSTVLKYTDYKKEQAKGSKLIKSN